MLQKCDFRAKKAEKLQKKRERKEGSEKKIALQTEKKRGRAQQKKRQPRFEVVFRAYL